MIRSLLVIPLVWFLGTASRVTGGGASSGGADGGAALVYRLKTETFFFDLECRVYRQTTIEECTATDDGGTRCVVVQSYRDDFVVPCDQLDQYRKPRVSFF